jgi:DNA polymerase-3 subunit delta'
LSKIIVTNNLEKTVEEIDAEEKIVVDEFKVEHVNLLKEVSYLASKEKKTIVLAAKKYNIFAQNALLKILEEPPKNTDFILITTSKYGILDTIKSRLPIEYKKYEISKNLDINLDKINNNLILELLKKDLEKEEIKLIIYKLIEKKDLKNKELEVLNNAIKMLELNIDKKAILAYIMLHFKGKE